MRIQTRLQATPASPPCGLVIGAFDGVHLGHRLLIDRLKSHLHGKGTLAALTFRNHPSQILKPQAPVFPLCTQEEKCRLLEEAGIDLLFLLDFSTEFAALPYDLFLKQVKAVYPFDFLVVGKGDAFGKNREGTEERVKMLEKPLAFVADYVDKLTINNEIVSSGAIRRYIQAKEFKKAEQLLGHPYKGAQP